MSPRKPSPKTRTSHKSSKGILPNTDEKTTRGVSYLLSVVVHAAVFALIFVSANVVSKPIKPEKKFEIVRLDFEDQGPAEPREETTPDPETLTDTGKDPSADKTNVDEYEIKKPGEAPRASAQNHPEEKPQQTRGSRNDKQDQNTPPRDKPSTKKPDVPTPSDKKPGTDKKPGSETSSTDKPTDKPGGGGDSTKPGGDSPNPSGGSSDNSTQPPGGDTKPPAPGGLAAKCCTKSQATSGATKTCSSGGHSYTCNCGSGSCR